jgi:hypothetical protein
MQFHSDPKTYLIELFDASRSTIHSESQPRLARAFNRVDLLLIADSRATDALITYPTGDSYRIVR